MLHIAFIGDTGGMPLGAESRSCLLQQLAAVCVASVFPCDVGTQINRASRTLIAGDDVGETLIRECQFAAKQRDFTKDLEDTGFLGVDRAGFEQKFLCCAQVNS